MDHLLDAGQRTLHLVILLSAPPVLIATVVGLLIGLFQTVTQLQEQTLPFGVKLLSVCVALALLSGWYSVHLRQFAEGMFALALRR